MSTTLSSVKTFGGGIAWCRGGIVIVVGGWMGARMGHVAHWLVLRKPLIPSSTACLSSSLSILLHCYAAAMYGRANHRKVMMQKSELG